MFIFRFMAGQVEAFAGGENDENYDPYSHRKVPKPTTYGETMMHMLKGCLGTGLLAMPNAISRLGIVFGFFAVLFISAFATYCIQILVGAMYQVCKKWKRGYISYPKCMRLAVQAGPPCMRWTAHIFAVGVDFFLLIWQIGICAIYLVFVAENFKQVLEFNGQETTVRMLIVYFLPIVIIMGLIKDLKLLAPLSTFSNICIMLAMVLVFFYLVQDDVTLEEDKFKIKSLTDIPIFIGIVLFALEAVGVVLALEYNMDRPREFVGLFGLFTIGMCIITVIYVCLGVFGYLKYGDHCEGSVTLNLPQDEKKAQVAKASIAVAIFLSFPLQNFVAWQILWRKLHKTFKDSKFADYILRLILVVIPFAMAVTAPSLGPFMGLIGALCLSMAAILFPAVMDLCVYYPNQYGFCNYKVLVDIFIIVFGAFCCCSGVYTSLLEMYD